MFFLSGAGALAFETVWFAQAGLVVGNAVWSAALTVGAFMAGLALGNALAIRLVSRLRNPVLGYAAVEVAAAVSGAALVVAFPFLPALFAPLLSPLLGEPVSLNAARAAIAFLLMAVPATALGATLPLLARPLEAATGSYGLALGRLYGVNTLGAVAGTLLAELVLVPELGLRGSGFAAAACNLGAAAIAWRIARGFAKPRRAPRPPAAARACLRPRFSRAARSWRWRWSGSASSFFLSTARRSSSP
jgi:predicted membrane-bound spermidine synthase